VVVGSIELQPVPDAVGLLAEYSQAYPEVPAEAWEPYRALYRELFSGKSWRLPCNCFLVRSDGVTILVDTGVGPPGLWDWTAEREGELPRALAQLGVDAGDIDIVFLTHLHIDHVGWNADLEGVALFPRARYVVHRDSLACARQRDGRAHVQRCIVALADRFETVDGGVELAPGVAAFVSPGHFPGHMAFDSPPKASARSCSRTRRCIPHSCTSPTGSTSPTESPPSAPRHDTPYTRSWSTKTSSSRPGITRRAGSAASSPALDALPGKRRSDLASR
jgi:hypothetical protein